MKLHLYWIVKPMRNFGLHHHRVEGDSHPRKTNLHLGLIGVGIYRKEAPHDRP